MVWRAWSDGQGEQSAGEPEGTVFGPDVEQAGVREGREGPAAKAPPRKGSAAVVN